MSSLWSGKDTVFAAKAAGTRSKGGVLAAMAVSRPQWRCLSRKGNGHVKQRRCLGRKWRCLSREGSGKRKAKRRTDLSPDFQQKLDSGGVPTGDDLTTRAGWVSASLLEWLRNAVQPPGSGTHPDPAVGVHERAEERVVPAGQPGPGRR